MYLQIIYILMNFVCLPFNYPLLIVTDTCLLCFILMKFFWFIVVQSPSCVQLFMTLWAIARQASLSPTVSQSLPKFMSLNFDTLKLWWWRRPFSPLDCKEIKPVNLNGNQPWRLIGRTDAEAEAPILWPPDANSQLIGKDPHSEKDWRQKQKRATELEKVGRDHLLFWLFLIIK